MTNADILIKSADRINLIAALQVDRATDFQLSESPYLGTLSARAVKARIEALDRAIVAVGASRDMPDLAAMLAALHHACKLTHTPRHVQIAAAIDWQASR